MQHVLALARDWNALKHKLYIGFNPPGSEPNPAWSANVQFIKRRVARVNPRASELPAHGTGRRAVNHHQDAQNGEK